MQKLINDKIKSYVHKQKKNVCTGHVIRFKVKLNQPFFTNIECITTGLVDEKSVEALQQGAISKEHLRDKLHRFLMGDNPIAGVLNQSNNRVGFELCIFCAF